MIDLIGAGALTAAICILSYVPRIRFIVRVEHRGYSKGLVSFEGEWWRSDKWAHERAQEIMGPESADVTINAVERRRI